MNEEKRQFWVEYDQQMKPFNRVELLGILAAILICAAMLGIGWMIIT